MKLKLQTVLVDDIKGYMRQIQDVFDQLNLDSEYVQYEIQAFSGTGHFDKARNFINKSLDCQYGIDLIITDYNLERGTGIELLKMFNNTKFKPYRFLLSNTDGDLVSSLKHYLIDYDKFVKSKTPNSINENLQLFENEIAKILLYGNHNFYHKVYRSLNNSSFLESYEQRKIGIFMAYDVMYVETCGHSKKSILHRKLDVINETIEIANVSKEGSEYSHNRFLNFNPHVFIQLNQSIPSANPLFL